MDLKKILDEATNSGEPTKYTLRSVDSIEEEVRAALLRMLERGSKSSATLRKNLVEKEYQPEIVDQLIARFIEVGLIDDYALARDIAESLATRKAMAKGMISITLREKGFSKDVIEDAVSSLDQDAELAQAISLAEAKLNRMQALEKDVRARRVAGFLSRKGYSSSIVWKAIKAAEDSLGA